VSNRGNKRQENSLRALPLSYRRNGMDSNHRPRPWYGSNSYLHHLLFISGWEQTNSVLVSPVLK